MRLLCRSYKGRKLFYAQLVQEGYPKLKKKMQVRSGKSGLDIGPSTSSVYAHDKAELGQFCAGLDPVHRMIRTIQRKMDRSRRATTLETTTATGPSRQVNERLHRCPSCGIRAQRDLYSAFLACHVSNDVLDRESATASWPGAESLLMQAMSRVQHESANAGNIVPQSFGLGRSRSGLSVKGSYHGSDKVEGVAFAGMRMREPLKEAVLLTPGTPRL